MDRVFEIIFGAVMDSQSPPLCIKFLFDFLDFQAESLGIHDPGVLHAWKANWYVHFDLSLALSCTHKQLLMYSIRSLL